MSSEPATGLAGTPQEVTDIKKALPKQAWFLNCEDSHCNSACAHPIRPWNDNSVFTCCGSSRDAEPKEPTWPHAGLDHSPPWKTPSARSRIKMLHGLRTPHHNCSSPSSQKRAPSEAVLTYALEIMRSSGNRKMQLWNILVLFPRRTWNTTR